MGSGKYLKSIRVIILLCSSFFVCCNKNVGHETQHATDMVGVVIGDQIWSASNLDVAVFRNGDSIPEIKSNTEWEKAGKEGRPGWCYYQNEKGKTEGRMYNWYAMNDPRGLSPEGWHVPSNEEWIALETHLGIDSVGIKIKCYKGWDSNGNGNNRSGLCISPGGYRGRDGRFTGAGEFVYLSTISEAQVEDSKEPKMFIWGRGVQFAMDGVMRCGLDKEFGLYVRCIKDKH